MCPPLVTEMSIASAHSVSKRNLFPQRQSPIPSSLWWKTVSLQYTVVKKKTFELRPWRSFLLGIGSARSAPMKNNDDIPTTDTTEINQLINRVKRGELDQGDAGQ